MIALCVRKSGFGVPVDPDEWRIKATFSEFRLRRRTSDGDCNLLYEEHESIGRQLTSLRQRISPNVERILGDWPYMIDSQLTVSSNDTQASPESLGESIMTV